MLRTGGYSVDAFPSARSFLEGYDPRRGGCLLLDIRMPGIGGLEICRRTKACENGRPPNSATGGALSAACCPAHQAAAATL